MAKREYDGEGIRVLWESDRCIHTMRCLTDEPGVFDVRRRPWIDVTAAPADRIAAAIDRCPTGALRYERTDGSPQEKRIRPTRVVPAQNGPVVVKGDLRLEEPSGELLSEETRLTLCRCGKTENPPFCDNQHRKVGFEAEGLDAGGDVDTPDDPPEGPTSLRASKDGPLLLSGDLSLESPRGEPVSRVAKVALCRCGESAKKPFCDGSHVAAGYTSEGEAFSRRA